VARAGVAVGEALEALHSAGLPEGPVTLSASFDEYKLVLGLEYSERSLKIAERKRFDLEAFLEDEGGDRALDEAVSDLSSQLIRNLADQVTSSEHGVRARLELAFSH
jgi:hypothetical protein